MGLVNVDLKLIIMVLKQCHMQNTWELVSFLYECYCPFWVDNHDLLPR